MSGHRKVDRIVLEKEVLGLDMPEEVKEERKKEEEEDDATPKTATDDAEENGGEKAVVSSVEANNAPDGKSGEDERKGKDATGRPAGGGKRKKPRRRQRHRRGGRERHTQHPPHKWKPYDKLTWAERHALEERETERALRVREERFASGLPVAPYNTTQFLMEDHINSSGHPKLSPALAITKRHKSPRQRHCSAPGGDVEGGSSGHSPGCKEGNCEGCNASDEVANSSDYDFDDDDDMDSAFLAKEEEEFSQTYDTIHAESLHNMSKNQLVIEYMELEAKLEEMTKNIRREDSPWPPGLRLNPMGNSRGPTFDYNVPPHSPSKSCNQSSPTAEEMARLREKVEVLEKENERMKEEMRRISAMSSSSSSSSTTTTTTRMDDDGGGGIKDDED